MRRVKTATGLMFLLFLVLVNHAAAQSLVTGSIVGTVKDPSAAIVPNAPVDLQNTETGEKQSTTSNAEGVYRFALLKPGPYEVSVVTKGLTKIANCTVGVGQTITLDLDLEVTISVETVMVKDEAPLISSDPGTVTNFTPTEIALLPNPGGDITTIAYTAPGVVVTQGTGEGNFSVNGLPATSNVFTVNGENDLDPYFNVNLAGATNLSLGNNEIQEASVIANPYSGQYGQLSGAQITYVTKSGTNQFHGNAQWWWNGDYMNSNDFFSNATQTPRPFSNANQWAASLGGPIIKDHTWFFVDTEGLRFVLPNVDTVTIPTPAFASAVSANIQALEPNEASAYQSMFNIYANAAKGKIPTVLPAAATECALVSLPGWTTGSPCAQNIVTTPSSFAKEWILAGRVDQKLTSKDDMFFRFRIDRGQQPTLVDALNSAFDANSNQPLYDFQAQERHVFGANVTNLFTASVSHYDFLFSQNVPAWQSAFPDGGVLFYYAGGFSGINPNVSLLPSGRKFTQYQFIDDFSWVRGQHNLKFGVNFRRYDVSDHNFYNTYPVTVFNDLTSGAGTLGLQAFANGVAYSYSQQDSVSTDVPIALWGIGFYAEDDWKLSPHFTLMGALRFEHNSNPVCQINCFANFKGPFPTLATVQAGAGAGDVPYSSDININLHQAYVGVDAINVSPRLAFSWAPGATDHFPWFPGEGKTIISGGIGIFYDNPAAGIVDNLLSNPPVAVYFTISPLDAFGDTTGILPFDKTNGGPAAFAAAAAAFSINKSYNQLSNELNPIIGSNPPISFSSIEGTIHSPQVQEWNLKVAQQIGRSTAVSVNYVGNHSIHIPYFNNWWNAFASGPTFVNVPGVNSSPVVPNYGTVTTLQSGAVANYNGVTFSLREQYHSWFMAHVNYTFSHALDEVSNGGLYPAGNYYSGAGILIQMNPGSLRANNYGNADYDIRNLFNADYVITPAIHFENKIAKGLLGGWQWSGKVFVRSGLPYSVTDGRASGDIAYGAATYYQTAIVAQQITGGASNSCGRGAADTNTNPIPCVNNAAFLDTGSSSFTGYTRYPTQTRNQFRGPNYIDFDMGLFKTFAIKERMNLGVGMTAFNVFNHPNFNLPDGNLGDPTFGQITSTQRVPTSPYGNLFGFDSSVRVVQLSAKLSF